MGKLGIGALLIEPGASLVYFTGVQWWRSERLTAAVIAARRRHRHRHAALRRAVGARKPAAFRPTCACGTKTRIRSPPSPASCAIARSSAPVGVEETVRYFAVDAPAARDAGRRDRERRARGARLPHGQVAGRTRAHAEGSRHHHRRVSPRLRRASRRGMTPDDIGAMMDAAHAALGASPEFALILLGEASAYPHGSGKPQAVRDGEVVLMDCGCTVEGYQSDISRTFVFGEATAEQRKVWQQMRDGPADRHRNRARRRARGQRRRRRARAVREVGLRPGLQTTRAFASHRSRHRARRPRARQPGARRDRRALAPGMCFSNEPGIYLPGKFGIRLEDCFHMGAEKPIWFSTPPPSLDKPFG